MKKATLKTDSPTNPLGQHLKIREDGKNLSQVQQLFWKNGFKVDAGKALITYYKTKNQPTKYRQTLDHLCKHIALVPSEWEEWI